MMTPMQFRLCKLAEENSEVIKECSKLSINGPDTRYLGRRTRDLLREEMIDVMMCYQLLVRMGVVDRITQADVRKQYLAKRGKIVRKTHDHIAAGAVEAAILNYIPETL